MTESKRIHKATNIYEARKRFDKICGGNYGEIVTIWNKEYYLQNDEVHATCLVCGAHGETDYIGGHPDWIVVVARVNGSCSDDDTIRVDEDGDFVCGACLSERQNKFWDRVRNS